MQKFHSITAEICKVLSIRIVIGFIFYLIFTYCKKESVNNSLLYMDWTEKFMLAVIAGPLIETTIFQFAIIEALLSVKSLPIKKTLSVIASTLAFALTHFQSTWFFLSALSSGALYAIFYIRLKIKYKSPTPFLIICVSHSLYNLFVFMQDYFKWFE